MKNSLLIILTILFLSCNSQEKENEVKAEIENPTEQINAVQIGEYVVETFQDSKGDLWFGTLSYGAAKYDGKELVYLTTDDGLPSNRIVNVIEDAQGNLWFGSGLGISKFDGKTFTNYSEKDGLCSNMISSLLIDSKGTLWIGTWAGVCRFDGDHFEEFPISYPKIETQINPDTKDWTTSIIEDSQGNIWFGRDGYGACKYDGHLFTHFTTKDGLNSNNVQSITEDSEGNIWIGTRVAEKDNADTDKRMGKGGLNKFDGEDFINFPNIEGLSNNDVYTTYKDSAGHLWISTINNGVYKYHDGTFINYDLPHPTMSFLEDQTGNIWLGCAGGLYSINSKGEIRNITVNGPWL